MYLVNYKNLTIKNEYIKNVKTEHQTGKTYFIKSSKQTIKIINCNIFILLDFSSFLKS